MSAAPEPPRPRPYFLSPPTHGLGESAAATPPAPLTPEQAAELLVPTSAGPELELAPAILARILTTGDAAVYTAADGSRFLGLDYSTVDLTDAEAAYLEALDR
jgi:hypothetical protein